MRPLLEGKRLPEWRDVQFAERGQFRMVSDGRWKLVREYFPDQPARETWYDLAHPLGERNPADLPSPAVRGRLMVALERFFSRYEDPAHSGRHIWDQPPPNARMRDDLAAN